MSGTANDAVDRLDDYLRGKSLDLDEDDYEKDLFARALCGTAPELSFLAELGARLREMDQRGTLDLWLTLEDVERLKRSGRRIAYYELDPQNPTGPELPADAELLLTKILLDLRGVRRLEAEVVADDGRVLKTMPDIRFDPAHPAVYACCEVELARTAASAHKTSRLWATDAAGERRLLCELHGM